MFLGPSIWADSALPSGFPVAELLPDDAHDFDFWMLYALVFKQAA